MIPLPYHQRIATLLKQQAKTWGFFSLPQNKEQQLVSLKIDLLKNTYKFDETVDSALYEKIKIAKAKLQLDIPVTIYQADNAVELNASIVYLHREAHIIFSGAVMKLLNDKELLAVLAHELSHVKLFDIQAGELETADQIITAIAENGNQDAAYHETARLFKLYTEVFCDRGALLVTGSTAPIITSLVKLATGLEQVNADAYIKQAEEIYALDATKGTEQFSHPENFIRARAVHLWQTAPATADAEITKMIEGFPTLDNMDIFQQKTWNDFTEKILKIYLKPKWFQSTLVLGLAKQYFPTYTSETKSVLDSSMVQTIQTSHISFKEYVAYLLLDFSLIDISLEQIPLGWALQLSEDLGLREVFDNVLKKELKLGDKKLLLKKQQSLQAFHAVKENEAEQIYE